MSLNILILGVKEDARYIEEYEKHSSMWKRASKASGEYTFFAWEDLADPTYRVSISTNIASADIIGCMVSANFLFILSQIDFIWDALEAKSQDEHFRVIPIVVRECEWKKCSIIQGKLALYANEFSNLDTSMKQIVQGMQRAASDLLEDRKYNPLPTVVLSPPRYCNGCGTELETSAAYCTACGRQVGRKGAPSPLKNYYTP